MKTYQGQGDTVIYRHDDFHNDGFEVAAHVFDSVVVQPVSRTTERVTVCSRGRHAGYLILAQGDGERLARLILDPS